jgi:uncharacterized membrane protein YphA (DoxX/SURF4 family)
VQEALALLGRSLQLLLGGVFLWAGFGKLKQPMRFADAIRAYEVLPSALSGLAAVGRCVACEHVGGDEWL